MLHHIYMIYVWIESISYIIWPEICIYIYIQSASIAAQRCYLYVRSAGEIWIYVLPLPCSIVQYSSIMSIAMVPIICISATIPACLSHFLAATLPQLPIPLWPLLFQASAASALRMPWNNAKAEAGESKKPQWSSHACSRDSGGFLHLFLNETIVSLTGFMNYTKGRKTDYH